MEPFEEDIKKSHTSNNSQFILIIIIKIRFATHARYLVYAYITLSDKPSYMNQDVQL